MARDMTRRKLFPIGYVARQTGLSVHVIRAWERRYGIVVPKRTPKNRRMYSRRDVARLILCRKAVACGHSISQLAGIETHDLQALAAGTPGRDAATQARGPIQPTTPHVDACRRAVNRLDARGLENGLHRAAAVLPRISLFDDVIAPLLAQIGRKWATGSLKIVHEHMASAVIQSYLTNALRSTVVENSARPMVAATPAGQWCQLGALMSCVAAADTGWKPYYFGPNLPADEIVTAAVRMRARVVALSIAYRTVAGDLERDLDHLQSTLPAGVRLFLGGGAAGAFRSRIATARGRCFTDLKTFAIVMGDQAAEAEEMSGTGA